MANIGRPKRIKRVSPSPAPAREPAPDRRERPAPERTAPERTAPEREPEPAGG